MCWQAGFDPTTRMVTLVLRDGRRGGPFHAEHPALRTGTFCRVATNAGGRITNAFVIPCAVLRDRNKVFLIEEGRLARRRYGEAVIGAVLRPGDRPVVSAPSTPAVG